MRSNKRKEGKLSRIVSVWSRKQDEKSNEITALSELLDKIQVKGQIITIDAIETQKAIAEKNHRKLFFKVQAIWKQKEQR